MTLFAHEAKDQSLWSIVLEKAFAKLNGNYGRLIAGDPRDAALALVNAPSLQYSHTSTGTSMDELWERLLEHDVNNELMIFEMKSLYNGAKYNDCGLQSAHAYVVLKAIKLSNGARLVQVRNPWGREGYTCDWSDSSALWTDELRQEAGATPQAVNEGIFFMSLEDYFGQGQSTIISFDTTGWYQDYFLRLNDGETESPGKWSWCGETCTRHTMKVKSTVD